MDAIKEQKTERKPPGMTWELGTAYDLMISLEVLHNPEGFGLRASWAAGVRSRVPASERGVLEDSLKLVYVPLIWIHSLPEPNHDRPRIEGRELKSSNPTGRMGSIPTSESLNPSYLKGVVRII